MISLTKLRPSRAAPILLSALVIALNSGRDSFAAQIEMASNRECPIQLTGEIVNGDFDRIKRAISSSKIAEYHPDNVKDGSNSICLNSPGGSFLEGMKIAKLLFDEGIGTRIPAKSKCGSACALIFMAGRVKGDEDDGPHR